MTIDEAQGIANEVAEAYGIPPPEVSAYQPRADLEPPARGYVPVMRAPGNRLRVLPAAFDILTVEEMRYAVAKELALNSAQFTGIGCAIALLPVIGAIVLVGATIAASHGWALQLTASAGTLVLGLVVGVIFLSAATSLQQRFQIKSALKLTRDADAALSYTEKCLTRFIEGVPHSRVLIQMRLADVRKVARRLGIA